MGRVPGAFAEAYAIAEPADYLAVPLVDAIEFAFLTSVEPGTENPPGSVETGRCG